jgi:hypothetical protein
MGENMTSSCKLFAAAMSVGILSIPCAVRAAVTIFDDNFSGDTATFAYPGTSANAPGTPSPGPGTWVIGESNTSDIQAGVITNTLPGGGTGGADGNTHYMAIQRPSGASSSYATAVFSQAVSTGTLSVQWDDYQVGPGRNFQIYLDDSAGAFGNPGPFIESSYYSPPNSGDQELTVISTDPGDDDIGGFPNNAWVHMDMEVNLSAQTYQLLVNGVSQGTFNYYDPGSQGPLQSLSFYGVSSADETLYVDNVDVTYTPVPEPASCTLLLAVGGLVAFGRRLSHI